MALLRQMLMSSIYGLANDKCQDFQTTVLWISHIDKTCNGMAD